jgi:hypothetical protein
MERGSDICRDFALLNNPLNTRFVIANVVKQLPDIIKKAKCGPTFVGIRHFASRNDTLISMF